MFETSPSFRGQDGESQSGPADADQPHEGGGDRVADEARLADWHTGFRINHVSSHFEVSPRCSSSHQHRGLNIVALPLREVALLRSSFLRHVLFVGELLLSALNLMSLPQKNLYCC